MKKITLLVSGLFLLQTAIAQQLHIAGSVTASDDKQPLSGVSVKVKGSAQGTVTDINGKYTIPVKQGRTLVFSSVGFKEQEKTIHTEGIINIVLEPDIQMLDQVIAIGYGTMKKSDVTGAVTSIKAEQLQRTPAAGLDQALQGRAAGVTVNANSGQPGAPAVVRIRGIGTVNDSSPIYVVDGIILSDISFLSPNDIESTEILKDASATAIYGSRGANGVILVTTKKGKTGKATISVDAYTGIQNRWNKLELMKSKEFAKTIIDLNRVQSQIDYYNQYGFNRWLNAYRLGSSPYYPLIKSSSNPDGLNYAGIETDWQDEVFNPNALIQNYYLSVDGGNDKSSYSFSSSYFNQQGTIIGSNYNRLTIRFNSAHQVKNWLKVGQNLSFVPSYGRNAMNNNASPGASILSAALAMAPWDPTHYPAGSRNLNGKDLSGQISASSNFKNVTNPFSMVEHSHPSDKNERLIGDAFVEITPIKGLLFRSDVSLDLSNSRNRLFKDAYQYSDYDQSTKNFLSSSMTRNSTLRFENTLTYTRDIGKHSFSVMGGQTTEEYNYYTIGGSGASILNPESTNWYLSQTTEDRTYSSDGVARTRMFSLLGRLHYSYNNRYLATFNFRADASSKFPENLWGYFPSTALAWRISDESWMKNIPVIDYLKLRVGWGQIGNEKIGSDNFTLKMFNTGPTFVDYVLGSDQQLANGATILTYVNKGGRWERTEQLDAGIDFGLFKSKFSGTIDLFQRDTKDMLLSVKAPAYVGNRYDAIANVGTVRNKGIELTLTYQNKATLGTKLLNYAITGNASVIKNELTALNGGQKIYGTYTLSDQGLPLFSLWGYEYEGIYKTDQEALAYLYGYDASSISYHAGDAKYKDLNGDGKIDDADKTKIGNPFPWLTYGLNLSADWNRFDVQVFFQGVYGNQLFNAVRMRTEGTGLEATLSTSMRNAWTPDNSGGDIPNPYSSVNQFASTRFVESGAYLRLKNVQIGYTLPASIKGINRCRIYLAASNLLTFTKYTGYDPEIGSGVDFGNYPQARTVMLGANINF
ncbi:TonB-dependent receptor (plasmid) [Pedobacter sp. BS3]|uniref:SusC/RagA family TonB-linked outer membrane protein n=1 Tax=Pedobacter sp. BS3 TaxID=2567937 RepID=UPI0011EE3B9A|nr:TonB-dependent receptor [Pedobacter sp. BS3]TZF86008.1 TonB-dependent receptor [Pedobacter sp. BS3]